MTAENEETTSMKNMPSSEDIFSVLSDDISTKMLKLAATGFRVKGDNATKLQITEKQYYNRLHKLVKIGLIHKRRGVYTLTTLGSIVDKILLRIADEIVTNYWELHAINSFANKDIPFEEKSKIIDSMLTPTSLIKKYLKDIL